ncbi:5-formyltetrahydrofolate cyclo-ligase [Hymenobacter sp.]|jgi:5-formyltetrahydrofolate cyclo-ligase|uniref:5-formyltetrahydrofolate cyclo-ligase n=1 Tax=Hymenobacter sp. TaxID=1898978 RepID=UPI002ED7B7FC
MSVKAELRQYMLARRKALPPYELARRSTMLRKHLFYYFSIAQWEWLHVFLPIPQQHEPDTWEIIRWIWEYDLPVKLAVPVVQPDGVSLRHHHLTPDTRLVTNRWGIPEPVEAPEVFPQQLDAVLIPLLAFDITGHRVGYGKGFYDRFLSECRPDALRIGMSWEQPVPAIEDASPHDVRLHACLTPMGIRWFGAEAWS